jgi:sulfite reductase (NADPH) hemoprotein beta-component
MYQYDAYDKTLVTERADQFRGQVSRRLDGGIAEDEFKPLRLQNGLYMQLHAYMLRVAIPYGLLSSTQLRRLAHIARRYDKGYGHFTTRQNIQYNWPALTDVPAILAELAEVEMHAIQTSGNCIRNVTSDPYAGVAKDEIEDPRPYCEIIRQWSTFHPEFAALPRKFKIAVTGAVDDRAAIAVHDIGLRLVRNDAGEVGFEVRVGGGLGRTPILAPTIRPFLEKKHLLSYLEAILRVYNRFGRRDNKHKARIKIQVKAVGAERFAELVEAEWQRTKESALELDEAEIARMQAYFVPPPYQNLTNGDTRVAAGLLSKDRSFSQWVERNVVEHKVPGYAIVALSLKSSERPPGDVTAAQMDAVADLADRYSFGLIRTTYRQNLVFSDVRTKDLPALHRELVALDLATPNVGTVTDIISCPGLDYCNLANARSISVAAAISERFTSLDHVYGLGDVTVNISGCINACGHHHTGNIGILGIDKQGVEHYQLMLGGSADNQASLGGVLGRALTHDEIAPAVERVLARYLEVRESAAELFLDCYRRLGAAPFKEAVYGAD